MSGLAGNYPQGDVEMGDEKKIDYETECPVDVSEGSPEFIETKELK